MPQPRNWDKKKLLKWLDDNPITDTTDVVEFLKDTVCVRRAAAERNAKARAEAKESQEKSGGAMVRSQCFASLWLLLIQTRSGTNEQTQ
jgi:hypothetical protein